MGGRCENLGVDGDERLIWVWWCGGVGVLGSRRRRYRFIGRYRSRGGVNVRGGYVGCGVYFIR